MDLVEEEEAASAEPEASLEWSAFYDEAQGRLFYYNSTTDESAWDPPADGKFNPPPPFEESVGGGGEASSKIEPPVDTTIIDDFSADNNIEDPRERASHGHGGYASAGAWVVYQDEGRDYYYNTETGETQWDEPDGYVVPAPSVYQIGAETLNNTQKSGEEIGEMSDNNAGPSASQGRIESINADEDGADEVGISNTPSDHAVPYESEEEIDPAAKRVQDAEAALHLTDSILEPSCIKNVAEVVTSEGGNPQKAISALIDNYQGQTAVCGLLAKWLADLRTASSSSASSSEVPSQTATDQVREVAQDVINRVAKERFSKETGDQILDLSKSEAAFLEDMMDSPRWRRLLIDLSASHKDSAVLVYCLRAISKRGHHREIAKRVNQSDHFAVFSAMLQSELTIIGSVAVSSGGDATSSIGLDELVSDLRRVCSSTSYTYLYSIEVLRALEAKATRLVENSNSNRFRRAIRKWQAVGQNLESAMIDPTEAASIAGSSPLFRKRRLDVALTVSELHQRQRRRQKPQSDRDGRMDCTNGNIPRKNIETALLKFLTRYSVGVQLDNAAVDPLLPTGVDWNGTDELGKLLIDHPLSVRAFLSHLYRPGSARVTSPVLRNKCARLVAFAVLAAEKAARDEVGHRDVSGTNVASDEVALTRMIVQGSQLCEQLEIVGSFLILVDGESAGPSASPGEMLCSLALMCAPVGQGVLLWAREFTHGHEFTSSASFATLAVSILSLVRVICIRCPFTRRYALEVALALAFHRHVNPDISYQTVNSIKEQSLRLLIILLTKGEVAPVLGRVTRCLQEKNTSVMDASLVRYFVGGILECVRPPVSRAFIESFGALLKAPKCIDAVRSNYFHVAHREALRKLLESFQHNPNGGGADSLALVSSLQALYGVDSNSEVLS
jgi:hypothetical protein